MSTYLHDKEVTYHKFRHQWMKQQNQMRQKLKVEDDFKWELPNRVQIQYKNNSDYGRCVVNPTSALKSNANRINLPQNSKSQRTLRYIGGVDISFAKPGAYEYDKACAGLTIYEYPSMKCVHHETAIVTLKHPYIAGFLAFREVSHLEKVIKKIQKERPQIVPDVILVDGNGILHYRRMGLATHLSMDIGIPCIGVAKKLLAIDNLRPDVLVPRWNRSLKAVGDFYKICGTNSKLIGRDGVAFALRIHPKADVVYVKIPLPTHFADRITRIKIKDYEAKHQNPYSRNGNQKYSQRGGRTAIRSHQMRNSQSRQQRNGRPIQRSSEHSDQHGRAPRGRNAVTHVSMRGSSNRSNRSNRGGRSPLKSMKLTNQKRRRSVEAKGQEKSCQPSLVWQRKEKENK